MVVVDVVVVVIVVVIFVVGICQDGVAHDFVSISSHDTEAPPSDQLRPDFTDELEISVVRHVVPTVLRVPREGDTCLPVRLVLRRVPVKVGQSLVIVVHPRVLLGVVAGDADLIMVRQTWTQGVCENEIIEKQTSCRFTTSIFCNAPVFLLKQIYFCCQLSSFVELKYTSLMERSEGIP